MGYERVLIFEDDVRLDPDLLDATKNALRELDAYDAEWDVLFLGSLLGDGMYQKQCTKRVSKISFFGGTHAYIVSARGLRNLVTSIEKVAWHIDGQMTAHALWGNLQVYMVSPGIAHQAGMEDTSMTEGGASDAWPALLNRAASDVSTFDNVPLNYWLTVPIGQLAPGIPINAWTVIALMAGLAVRKNPAALWSAVVGLAVLVVGQAVLAKKKVPPEMVLGMVLFFGIQTL
jgi:hypothetical protein